MDNSVQQQAQKCLACKKPLCKVACPLGNDIPNVLQLVKNQQYRQAVGLFGHAFGELCGYLCPHQQQCLGACVLNAKGNAVNFPLVERWLFHNFPVEICQKSSALQGKKVCVVGGGVSGLTFAIKVLQAGADVTVFEPYKLLSTLYTIPSFRLPRQVLDNLVQRVQSSPIKIVCQQVQPSQIATLAEQYHFVYVATGVGEARTLGIPGQELATTYQQCLLGKLCGNVVVVGGGNTAIDCARLAKSQGCNVTVVYRRSEEEMPAFQTEVDHAKNEGVLLQTHQAPVSLEKQGQNLCLTVAKTVSHNRKSLQITNETHQICCDFVVSALGNNTSPFASLQQQALPNVLFGGDVAGGSLVVHAIRDALLCATKLEER